MLLDLIGVVVDVLLWLMEFFVRGVFGWRFLVSPKYRAQTLARWQAQSSSATALEISGAVAGLILSAVLAVWIIGQLVHPV